MSIWPPLQPISALISEIESIGISLSVADGEKIRCTPAGRMTAPHTESLRQRRTDVIQYLIAREKKSQSTHEASASATAPEDDRQLTPTVWLIYEAPDGLEYAITKEDYDDARQWIWPADCPNPFPPLKPDGKKRWVAVPAGEYPTCMIHPLRDWTEQGLLAASRHGAPTKIRGS